MEKVEGKGEEEEELKTGESINIDPAISSKYNIIKHIGKGAYGEVYVGTKKEQGNETKYAIKVIRHLDQSRRNDLAVMRNEYNILKLINCSTERLLCLEDMFYYGKDNSFVCIITKYIENSVTLDDFIKSHALPISMDSILFIIKSICEGIEELHKKNIIHLDIKPDNIMINNDTLECVIIDYGMSCIFKPNKCSSSIVGSLNYLAPEILYTGDKGPWCDIYSLGTLITYLISSNAKPFFENCINAEYKELPESQRARISLSKYFVANKRNSIQHKKCVAKIEDYKAYDISDKLYNVIKKMVDYHYILRPTITEVIKEL